MLWYVHDVFDFSFCFVTLRYVHVHFVAVKVRVVALAVCVVQAQDLLVRPEPAAHDARAVRHERGLVQCRLRAGREGPEERRAGAGEA